MAPLTRGAILECAGDRHAAGTTTTALHPQINLARGRLDVLLADGVNLDLRKMADACDAHTFWELLRIGKWHVREETTARALAMIVEAQSQLPMAGFWGGGTTSSSDGQHFPAGSTGEALNVVNAR